MITNTDKILAYEQMMHDFNMYRDVNYSPEILKKIVDLMCSWSYAHRSGNGEEDNDILVETAFKRIQNRDYLK